MLIVIYMDNIVHKTEILKCIFPFSMNASRTGCGVSCTPDTEQLLAELRDVSCHELPISRMYRQ